LKANPELSINPHDDWLKSHPDENAYLALQGDAKVLTQKAYDIAQKMIKDLDIPDNAVSQFLPPADVAKPYFDYQDLEDKFSPNSAEVRLHLLNNPGLVDWLNKTGNPREIPDTPIASLELTVKNRTYLDTLSSYSDKESPDYIPDEKARAEAVKKLRAASPGAVDDMRRIEAIEKGAENTPTDPKIIDSHVAYMRIEDIGGKGVEAKTGLFRVDDEDYNRWRESIPKGEELHLEPLDRTKTAIWRIDVKYAKEDKEYQAILDKYKNNDVAQREATKVYLADKEDYRKDRLRRDAHEISNKGVRFPTSPESIENYVTFNELPLSGKRRDRFYVEHPDFAKAMQAVGKLTDIPDPAKVPAAQFDDLYDEYKDLFNQHVGIGDAKSEFFIEKPTPGLTLEKTRDNARQELFNENPAFKEAYYRRRAYEKLFPEQFVNNYTTYMLLPDKGYEKERYLASHQDFYLYAKGSLGWTDYIDFKKIPSAIVENLYNQYQTLKTDRQRETFRYNNTNLDAWLFLTGKVTRSILETYRQRELTPSERFKEEATAAGTRYEQSLSDMRKRLEALK
jgi:hypothetical protein